MDKQFYINRTLVSDNKNYTESELIANAKFIVILAEPGAGKTELLKSLARRLKTKVATANVFLHSRNGQVDSPQVIDAFDELAKIDAAGIDKLLGKISDMTPSHVIISSRSSEWNISSTSAFEQFIGHAPTVVKLCEFDDSEQQEIYHHLTNKADFAEFKIEITRFSLEPLLQNPLFLRLFANAYIESNGNFTDKQAIFAKAIEYLAKESNPSVKPIHSISINKKVELSAEVFTKLLLSGSEGVAASEISDNRIYPVLGSLLSTDNVDINHLLATSLFKPGDNADLHIPVHKIAAEYSAAVYLVKRFNDSVDPLTLSRCLPIIAPNSTVRGELRGLLGWIATLGNKEIEETVINLDPYAVLANGDPSQLTPASKQSLLLRLTEIEAVDPYFRRGDLWRRFSVAGFFTQDVIVGIKPIITDGNGGHLRGLLLELLVDSKASRWLVEELQIILLSPVENKEIRLLALKCLHGAETYNSRLDLNKLIMEASPASLHIAAYIIEALKPKTFELIDFELFFRNCVGLYPSHKKRFNSVVGDRYFIKRLISHLHVEALEYLLDSLSKGLACTCGKKEWECDCRTGISKIIGSLLDHYFNLVLPPFNPSRILQWVRNLHFPRQGSNKEINSVKILQEDHILRQGIIAEFFGVLADDETIFNTKYHRFSDRHSHGGLLFQPADYKFVVDLAFENDNIELWVSLISLHQLYNNSKTESSNSLRNHMRKQAHIKPEFMRRWALKNRQWTTQVKLDHKKWYIKDRRLDKRLKRKKNMIRAENIKYVQENRSLVESGTHRGCLDRFANLTLRNPEDIEKEFGDEKLVRYTLINCLDVIAPDIPDLKKLAELQCESKGLYVETILFASCIEIMRTNGNLESVKLPLLTALRTNLSISYPAVGDDEQEAFKAEIDRLVFSKPKLAEQFLRAYVEPQLATTKCAYPEVGLLKYDGVFKPLQATLSIEWLKCFEELEVYALDILFELAVENSDREELKKVIIVRCSQFLLRNEESPINNKTDQKLVFWFIRAFYFLSFEDATPYWEYLQSDPNSIFLFEERSSRMNRSEHLSWPMLTPIKIEAILKAFFDQWPKVSLPSSYGTGSPEGETAYRFLTDIVWRITSVDSDESISVLSRLIQDSRFTDIHKQLKSIQAEQIRKKALINFEPPSPQKIVNFLDKNDVVTVEGLRHLIVQELTRYQKDIDGGEYNAVNRFYNKDEHLNEVGSVEIISERLDLVLNNQNITITTEHQTKNQNRIDITAAKLVNSERRLLVIEAKGQWHKELYSAATTQLYDRYSIHPDAAQQGIYLLIWFGTNLKVAGRKTHKITNALELKESIEKTLPLELKGLIDVFVLDVSRTTKVSIALKESYDD